RALARLEVEYVGEEIDLRMDLPRLLRRVDHRGIAVRHVLHGDARPGRQARFYVNDPSQRDAAAFFEFGSVENFGARSHEAAVADRRADDVGVRADDATRADREGIAQHVAAARSAR